MFKFLFKYFFVIIILWLTRFTIVHAQDIQFSQYYAVPFYQNPAFVGGLHHTNAGF